MAKKENKGNSATNSTNGANKGMNQKGGSASNQTSNCCAGSKSEQA